MNTVLRIVKDYNYNAIIRDQLKVKSRELHRVILFLYDNLLKIPFRVVVVK